MATGTSPADDSVRERAKAASLVVAVLTILVGADPLDIRGSSKVFRGLDYALIACWLVAIFLFLYAQTAKAGRDEATGEHRLRRALAAAAIATAFTVVLLGLKPTGLSSDHDKVLIEVTDTEFATIADLCKETGQRFHLYGDVRTGSLGDEFIVLTLDQHANSTCNEIKLPRGQIVALIEHPCGENGVTTGANGFCKS